MTFLRARWFRIVLGIALLPGAAVLALVVFGWPPSTHTDRPTDLGTPSTLAAMEAVMDTPGPIITETIVGADWSIDRSGLIDLSDPAASALTDGLEPIQVYVHTLRHPTRGLFLVDTGVEAAIRDAPDQAALRGFVASAAGIDRMHVRHDTRAVIGGEIVTAVLLTHMHLDHVSGLRDVPSGVPVLVGPGEASHRSWMNIATQSTLDRALEGHPIETWRFDPAAHGEGVVDVLGDGSLWAIQTPGHTIGSAAYVARTPEGPILFTGDTCHTAWGWEHDVPPGSFTEDREANRASLARLRALAARHPAMRVRLGHQALE